MEARKAKPMETTPVDRRLETDMNTAVQIHNPKSSTHVIQHALNLAQSYGVSSIRQLQVFLEIAENPSSTVDDLSGAPANDPANRAYSSIVRKLREDGYRGHDGLGL